MDLFDAGLRDRQAADQPLAARLRPRTLDEYVGQDHILGPGRLLRRAIEADQLSSLIFYGPPGTGKTTLAAVIAHTTRAHFISINAVLAGVADIRQAVDEAGQLSKLHSRKTILFIDEVHRCPTRRGPTRRAPTLGRKWHHHPHRRDHRKSLLLGQPPPAIAQPSLSTPGP